MTDARPSLIHALRRRAETEPLGVDVSDYSDEFCTGFLAGQVNGVDAPGPECPTNAFGSTVHEFPSATLGTKCFCGQITWSGGLTDA